MNGKTIQQKFSRSKAWRRALREYARENGLTEYLDIISEIMQEIIECYSDNQIRDICLDFLRNTDLKQVEKSELLHLLYLD